MQNTGHKLKIVWALAAISCFLFIIFGLEVAYASHLNIDTNNQGYRWAWNDIVGWIDFHNNVQVMNNELRGWAISAAIGDIVLNCATTPSGDICGQSDFKVVNSQGILSGWAWSDAIGWIKFRCDSECLSSNYGVTIDSAGSESFFHGWAWNDAVGWISFHCENHGACNDIGGSFANHKIQTSAGSVEITGWLESNVFDTGSSSPAYNYMMWRGIPKTGAKVFLQLATSNSSSGPWTGAEFDAPLEMAPDVKVPVGANHQGKRYLKYRVSISNSGWSENSPVVEDVIINYSP